LWLNVVDKVTENEKLYKQKSADVSLIQSNSVQLQMPPTACVYELL